ncbi:MAG TPA: hypothetical protein VKA39_01275 [Beijerinckiaceae bacterium]|nr:hypothetical protein [Beijerinckiaceae bacterium]
MVVVLYAVASAMVLGGAAAAIHGYGIIMVERGWTLVIAGAVLASGGAVLAGVAQLGSRVAAIQRDTARLWERFGRLDPAALPTSPTVSPAPLSLAPRGPVDLADPPVDPAPEPGMAEPTASPAAEHPASGRTRPKVAAAPEPLLSDVPLRGTTGPGDAPDERPAPAAEASRNDAPPEPSDKPAVVGTYDSGGNHYVMFSDGSIEADTPTGVFRFASLDELKDFIASGGESGAAPA